MSTSCSGELKKEHMKCTSFLTFIDFKENNEIEKNTNFTSFLKFIYLKVNNEIMKHLANYYPLRLTNGDRLG